MLQLQSFLNDRVLVQQGDLTQSQVDAIVNAANSSLLGGGGVDGAIHRAGGPTILAACRELRKTKYPKGLPTGDAVATVGGNLRAKHVIHTAGPIYGNEAGSEGELLAACYRNSLRLTLEQGWSTIAFPAISTGIYGYPRDEAARVSSTAIRDQLAASGQRLTVHLVFFDADDAAVFLANHCFGDVA